MHLIMFDLDGTLVDSNMLDSQCYLQALVDVFGFDLDTIDRDWGNYPHITDAGILQTLCQVELGRAPTPTEIGAYQHRFLELLVLACREHPLQSIGGAREIGSPALMGKMERKRNFSPLLKLNFWINFQCSMGLI